MDLVELRAFLGWSAVLNYLLLLWWFAFFTQGHDFVYRLHGRWFDLEPQRFDAIHYQAMALYKVAIFLFCLVPYLALLIVGT